MIRLIYLLRRHALRFAFRAMIAVVLPVIIVVWCDGYRLVVRPVGLRIGQRDWQLRANAGSESTLDLCAEKADNFVDLCDGRTHSCFAKATVMFEYFFVPETVPVGIPPVIFGGVGGTCPNEGDPLIALQRIDRFPPPILAYRVGIFWVGKPNALHLLTCSETEREAYRRAVIKHVCE